MIPFLGKGLNIKEKRLRYHLLIIEFLIVIVPFLILFYILYRKNIFLAPSQMAIIAFTLVLILSGLIILRQIFDRFSLLAATLKKVESGEKAMIGVQRDTAELCEITGSLNALMSRLEEATGQLQQRVFELFTIKELTKVADKVLDMDALLSYLLDKAMAVSKAQIGSVLMVESETQQFRVAAARGLDQGPRKGTCINIHDTLLQYIIAEKRPLLVQDIEADPRTRKPNDPKYGAPSFLSMPIFVGEGMVGVLNLSCKETGQAFDSNDEHIVSIMIGEIGFALDNVRLHCQAAEHVKNLQERTVELNKSNEQLQREIAERKQLEEEREDTNKFLTNILDSSSSISIISTDLEQDVLFWNRGAESIFGYTAGEMVGHRKIDILYLDDDTEKEIDAIRSLVLLNKKNVSSEVREVTKDGRTLWINLNVSPRFDEEGNVIGTLGIGEDITERKRVEEALRESEEKYRTILESIEEGYFEVDLAGNLAFFNDSVCEILGYSRGELVGMSNREYTTPQAAKRMYKIFNRVYSTGRPSSVVDYEVITKEGKKVILEISISLIRNSQDEPIGFRGVMRDVTERMRSEQERKRLEVQLQYAQRVEPLGTLARGIAHDFNNLLMGIMGNSSLLRIENDKDSPSYKRLLKIEKLVESGSLLTKQLLRYAREGRYEIEAINLNQVVKETSDTFAMAKKNIIVHHELDEDVCTIKADQGQIEQILWNLYVNAVDAMPGLGELFLRTRNVTDKEMKGGSYKVKPGNYVHLTVRDTGTGMEKRTMKHIFEPFFTTKGLTKGTGLGLATVYGIIKAYGGYIDVESTKGKGTIFNIYLPASQEKVPEKRVTREKIQKGNETLLLVDDEEMILEVNAQVMEGLGYTVLSARSGKEALEIFKENQNDIDLVILDMIMPDMGGAETYDHLKEINSDVKVLLSSGYSIDDKPREILERGCDGFIQKPFDMNDLSQKMRDILDAG